MDFDYFNKISKCLFYAFLVSLVLGLIGFKIADSISFKYQMVRNNYVNQIDGKDLSINDFKRIEKSLQTINDRFHTSESIAIYDKKDGINNVNYYDLDLEDAEYLFASNTVKKDTLLTEAFRVGEVLDAGKYYVLHYYYPDNFFLIPIALFTVSGILFIFLVFLQIKYAYNKRLYTLKLN